MYMQQLPGGLCFAHGPYEDTMQCPQWPKCITDPQQDQWKALSFRRAKKNALLEAAISLEEEDLFPATVAQLRSAAENYGDEP